MSDLLTLAKYAARHEERAAVLVLEDALKEASWLTLANAEPVYFILFGRPLEADFRDAPRADVAEWFSTGFRQAEVCEVALSEVGRRFLHAIVAVLDRQTPARAAAENVPRWVVERGSDRCRCCCRCCAEDDHCGEGRQEGLGDCLYPAKDTEPFCKACGKPIDDETNGFCDVPDDACWAAWVARQSPKKSEGQ